MRFRLIKLRFRRRFLRGQQQVEDLSSQAEKHIERHLLKRFGSLLRVRRFIFGWLSLMVLIILALVVQNLSLSGYYQTLQAVPGGIYNEGVEGRFSNASPLFATGSADATVSKLVFASLFKYDSKGKLIGELAKDYKVEANGSLYTVYLKPNLKWQDGQPLTSADVLFTYKLIQNPDVQSPLQGAWQGIEVTAPDPLTINFKLSGVLAAFPYSMTNGIVPEHVLKDIPPVGLRSADFNTVNPVGAGPFAWEAVEVDSNSDPKKLQTQIGLQPNKNYALGEPKLQKFTVQVFADRQEMVDAFADNQLTAIEGLDQVPKKLQNSNRIVENNLPLRAATMVFFKTSAGVLADQAVRQALVSGANVPAIIDKLGYPTRQVREPILAGQVGYDKSLVQPGFDLAAAKATLDGAGWKAGKNGQRSKDGRPLSFVLTAADSPETRQVARQLDKQWQDLGVKVETQLLGATEFQTALTSHSYEAILNGVAIGSDPDVFVYWDSSQSDVRSTNRLNFSEYNNPTADSALEAGRTRLDPQLRTIKYKPFLEQWQKDAPALGLYQPRVLYLTNGFVSGLSDRPINSAIDRLNNVENWQIREARVTN